MLVRREALVTLQQLIGGNIEDFSDLVREFIKEGQMMLTAAEAAAVGGDDAALKRAVHSLKSNARDLGADSFADLCAAIEADLVSGHPASEMTSRVAALLALWPGLVEALDAELNR